jgi:hypothetical protein
VGGSSSEGGGGRERGTRGREPKARSEISKRALKHFKPIYAEAQRHAENNELHVRKMVGGTRTEDNLPVDVEVKINGRLHGIEVKTMINNTDDKIKVRTDARERKEQWARDNKATVHTVVIDDRKKFGHERYSGHGLYYRRGAGSFRLQNMTKVTSASHLRRLMTER